MADEFLRSKLYEYGANSNLVLEAERDGNRRKDAGKGEVESLRGRTDKLRMGDRLNFSDQTPTKKLKTDHKPDLESKKSKTIRRATKVENIGAANDSYAPKSAETRVAFEQLLVEVQLMVGDQPHEALVSAASDVLSVLKNSSMSESQKVIEIRSLTAAQNISIAKLSTIGRNISDWKDSNISVSENIDENKEDEMAVVFNDDDESADRIEEEDEEEEEEEFEGGDDGVETKQQLKGVSQYSKNQELEINNINFHDIDAYWLQRQLSNYYGDANVSSCIAEEVLDILSHGDERICENKLVVLLDFDKFDLIKLLLNNRAKIFYGIKLKQAHSGEEREKIVSEMMKSENSETNKLLAELRKKMTAENWAQDRVSDFSKAAFDGSALKQTHPDIGEGNNLSVVVEDDGFIAAKASKGQPALGVTQVIRLADHAFSDGGHLMSNNQCTLPEQSWRAQKKGYEEVHVPALKPVTGHGETLVQIIDLPEWMQPAFEGMRNFNRVQSKLLKSALYDEKNLLLCAPTGSGKTNVALLCMLGMINRHRSPDGSLPSSNFKIVYIAPMKALVQECVLTFGKKLAPFRMNVQELSGDQSMSKQEIVDTHLIVTTPEKWDVVTRKVTERGYSQSVKLVIIDEVHLLHDERGPVLEALVARILRSSESSNYPVRIVGLSATLPNYKDVAAFLRVEPDCLHYFDNSYRPVPLQQQFIGIMEKKALKKVSLMNEICYEKAHTHTAKNQVLIFTHSRADTVKTAKAIRDLASENDTLSRFLQEGSASYEILKSEALNAKNADLKELLAFGFAVHHAGLSRSDRTLVEDLFADKHIKVLVSTATLAWGVNLPCRTVIIKGTQMYSPAAGRWTELSPLDILQMMGRAGRYGLDSEGEGIIITDHSELQYYLSLMNQQLPIESHLISRLPDILNAEIVLGSVSSLSEATEWLGYSYFFVRLVQNPQLYGYSNLDNDDSSFILARRNFAHSAISALEKHGLIKYDRKTGTVTSTSLGKIASYYYITCESISMYSETLRSSMSEVEILRLFSLSGEFKQVHVRDEERIELRSLISRVPIPIKESVEEPSAKINVLLQAYISRLKLEGFALAADMLYIQQSACRILRALFEIALKKEWASLSLKLLELCIMAERRMWKSQCSLRQFSAIPDVIARKLEKINTINWDRYFELSPQELGDLVKIPKMGKTLFRFVHMIPKLKINANVYPISRSVVRFEINLERDFEYNVQVHGSQILFWIIVEDCDRNHILHTEPLLFRANYDEYFVDFTVPMLEPMPPHYFFTITADRWLQSTVTIPVSFRKLILPTKFSSPTQLLDLQAYRIKDFKDKAMRDFFCPIEVLNPIQTQCFLSFHEQSSNVLLCSPNGSGKTFCGELAILRFISSDTTGKVIYVAANQDLAERVFSDWSERFEGHYNLTIALLSGDQSKDLEMMRSNQIIIASPPCWESISRKWRQRSKVFKTIGVVIFDDMHTISSEKGAVYEIAIARTRFIVAQLGTSVRFVGLSCCVANARDLGDMIGCIGNNILNFPPTARPIPLDIRILSVDELDYRNRLQAMSRPIYRAIINLPHDERVIIFSPTRINSQMLAIDLVAYSAADKNPINFVLQLEELMSHPISPNRDSNRLFILHEGMDHSLIHQAQQLFLSNSLRILVVPYDMVYKISSWAHLVVLMDTQVYDGCVDRFQDVRMSDLWQMMGLSGCHEVSGQSLICCHSSRKERLKMLLHDLIPIESLLDHNFHEFLNAEVVAKTITSKADAVDFLTWTFYYRRLAQNPNYYNLSSAGFDLLSDHLSELVENVVKDLSDSKCLAVEDDMDLLPLNLGMISAFYGISYVTVEIFANSITSKSKAKSITEILAAAQEVALSMRLGEDHLLKSLGKAIGIDFDPSHSNYGTEVKMKKALVLLHSHFSRSKVSAELRADQTLILKSMVLLVQALVDVISSQGWLKPALAAMEISQCIVQGMRTADPVLLQVPHFTRELVHKLGVLEAPVETVFDLLDMEDTERERLLCFSSTELSEIALFCNAYPVIQMEYSTTFSEAVSSGESVSVKVSCSRDVSNEAAFDANVVSVKYPYAKKEAWWIVIGDAKNNILYAVKRCMASAEFETTLEFSAPQDSGQHQLNLYLICDAYVGCDQEYEISLNVV